LSLFHTVIEETLVGNRKFLITILLKSMIRMLPFVEDGTGLMRDIQQFYQIGEMVYVNFCINIVLNVLRWIQANKELLRRWSYFDSGERLLTRRWKFESYCWRLVEHVMEESSAGIFGRILKLTFIGSQWIGIKRLRTLIDLKIQLRLKIKLSSLWVLHLIYFFTFLL